MSIIQMMFASVPAAGGYSPLEAPFGNVFSWGRNHNGSQGVGDTTPRSSPTILGAKATWAYITSGSSGCTKILESDRTLWHIGYASNGNNGLNNTTDYSSPVQIGALTDWAPTLSLWTHVIAAKADGTLWSWGRAGHGQLGTDSVSYTSSPNQVGALTDWAQGFTDKRSSWAIKTDGTLWSWGRNNKGQLGNGGTTDISSPVQVGLLTDWAWVSRNGKYGISAVKTDGTLWSWGSGNQGMSGLGTTTYYSSPVQVGALTNWARVEGQGDFAKIAIKTDGTLWGWGKPGINSLVLPEIASTISSPVQIGALTDWSIIQLRQRGGGAIKTDGTIWAWGENYNGAIGDDSTTDQSSPVKIGSETDWIGVACDKLIIGGDMKGIREVA